MSRLQIWRLRDGTANHCARCRGRHGQTKSEEGWGLAGTPPLHAHCSCSLDDTDQVEGETPEGPPDGASRQNSDGPLDPVQGDNNPNYPPGTPPSVVSGPTPPKPPPPTVPPSGGGNKRR